MPDEPLPWLASRPSRSGTVSMVGRSDLDRQNTPASEPEATKHMDPLTTALDFSPGTDPLITAQEFTASAPPVASPVRPTVASSTTSPLPHLIAALVASIGIVTGSIGPWSSWLVFSENGLAGDGRTP